MGLTEPEQARTQPITRRHFRSLQESVARQLD